MLVKRLAQGKAAQEAWSYMIISSVNFDVMVPNTCPIPMGPTTLSIVSNGSQSNGHDQFSRANMVIVASALRTIKTSDGGERRSW